MPLRWQTIAVVVLLGVSGAAFRSATGFQEGYGENRDEKSKLLQVRADQAPGNPFQSPEAVLLDYVQSADQHLGSKVFRGPTRKNKQPPPPAHPRPSSTAPPKKRIEFVFATVPDPEEDTLALEFDRVVESILRAVGNSGFVFDRSWFPWMGETVVSDPEKRERQLAKHINRRRNPGLLLFRGNGISPDRLLVVLLVAEGPEQGIDRTEFNRALDIHKKIQPEDPYPIRILGPTFSGSFPSLAEAILAADEKYQFRVISGTATHQALETQFTELKRGGSPANVKYNSVLHSDESALCGLQKYFWDELRGKYDTIAVLSEDATPFGGQYVRPGESQDGDPHKIRCGQGEKKKQGENEHRILNFRFPPGISRARDAYAGEAAAEKPAVAKLPDLGFSPPKKQDGGAYSNAVPTIAVQQTLASQEAVLLDLVGTLVRERTRLAVIVATDVLDELFLAQFLRKHVYDIRLCFLHTDLLFVHAARSLPLEGVLSVSTYPLHNRNQYWVSDLSYWDHQQRLVFPSQDAEGVYNACRALLLENEDWRPAGERNRPSYNAPALLDYRWAERDDQPPMWLSVVGRDGNYPVAHLKPHPEFDKFLYSSQIDRYVSPPPRTDDQSTPVKHLIEPNPPSGLWLSIFFLLSTIGFCLAILLGVDLTPEPLRIENWFVRLAGKWLPGGFIHRISSWRRRRWAGVFAVRPKEAGAAWRTLYVEVLGLTFLAFYFLFTLPLINSVIPIDDNTSYPVNLVFGTREVYVIVLVVLVLALLARFSRVIKIRGWRKIRKAWPFWWAIVFVCLFAALPAVLWEVVYGTTRYRESVGFFFLYRSLQLTSGVSPVLPMLFLVAALWHCGWVHFRRHVFILERRFKPAGLGNNETSARIRDLQKKLDRHARAFFPDLRQLIPAALLIWVLLNWFTPWTQAQGFEFRWYNDLFVYTIVLVSTLIYFAWWRLLDFWAAVRNFLEEVERHPLRRAFSHLPREYSLSLVWRSGGMRRRFTILTRAVECLRAIMTNGGVPKNLKDKLEPFKHPLEAAAADLLATVGRGDAETGKQHNKVQRALDDISKILVEELEPYWRHGSSE